MSSDKGTEAIAAEAVEVVLAAEKEENVQPVLEGDSDSTQDANDESRSAPQIDSVQAEGERDSNGQQEEEQQEQQQDGHDNHAGEEEDGGVKVNHEDDEEGEEGRAGEGEGDGDQNGHDIGGVSKKGYDEHSQPPPPQDTEEAEKVEEVQEEEDYEDSEEEEEADGDQSDSGEEEGEVDEEVEDDGEEEEAEATAREADVVQGGQENSQPEDAENNTEQLLLGEVIITPDTAVGIEPSQDTVENCTEAVKDPPNSSSPPSPSVSPPPQQVVVVEVEAPSPNNVLESTELLPPDDQSPPSDPPSTDEKVEAEDNKTDDNTGRDEAPDHTPSETTGEENNPNPAADTSAEDSAASATPVYASDSIDPILEGEPQEENTSSGEEQGDQEGEQALVVDRNQETLSSTDFAKPIDSSTYQPKRDSNNNNHIIITVIYDINEPLPLPPAGYQTATIHPDPPVAEQIEHVGTEVGEEEVDATPAADTTDYDEPQDFPAPEPQQEEANPNDSLKTDNGELPGEVEPLPAVEELPSVEVPPPAYTLTEPEKDVTQDSVVAASPIMSEVSALSNGTGSYKDATPPTLQQPFMEHPFETGFAAAPLDDEAAAAANAAALAMSAVGVPDGSRRSKKDRSHRKKDRSSGDGAEKEKKHRDRGDKGDRERAKSRDRGEKGKRDRSELGIGERRAKSRDRLRDDGKSRDRDRDPREKEKRHRTPEEKAEREARKAAKKGLIAPTPVYADIAAAPYEQYDQQQYDTQYEEERRRKKAAKRSGMIAGEFVEPQAMNGMEMPYEEERKEKKKSKKSRPPPIDTESTQQQYEQQQEEQLKRKKSSRKAAAILGEPAIMNEPPMSPYIDGPIEQPKRKKSSKRSPPPEIGAEPVQVVYEPDVRPPPANRRSRSDSLKNPIPGLINGITGSGEKKHSHKKKDSAHLSPEEREKRRRKHEDDKALRDGRELENHLYNGSKEKRKAEKAAQKAAKARAEALEGIPPPPLTPRYTDDLNLPIQNPDNQPEISPSVYGGDQYLQGQPHRDQQDLNAPNPEAPFSPRSFAASDDLAKAEKAARRAERRARKEREAQQTDGENLDHPKDSGHSLSSEGKREREHRHHKSRDKTDRTRSRSRPANPEEEEERRRRKEEKREARRLAALNGNEVRDGKEKKSKHREGGRSRSNSEKKQEKDMMREYEMGYPEGYGNASQQPWQAGGDLTDREDAKVGLMRRTFSKFLKF